MRAVVLLLALLAPACAAGTSTPPDVEGAAPEPSPILAEPVELADASPLPCERVFTPAPELRLAALAVTERWSRATGCPITVGEGGTPILLAESIPRPDGSEAPGATDADRQRILIHAAHGRKTAALMHELGHALGGEHVEGMGVLSGTEGHSDRIDAAALESVCTRTACVGFSPEVP